MDDSVLVGIVVFDCDACLSFSLEMRVLLLSVLTSLLLPLGLVVNQGSNIFLEEPFCQSKKLNEELFVIHSTKTNVDNNIGRVVGDMEDG